MNHTIDRVDVRLLDLPLVEPFAASHGTTNKRTLAVTKVSAGEMSGWGECSALPAATYSGESALSAFTSLVNELAPALLGASVGSAGPVHPGSMQKTDQPASDPPNPSDESSQPMATAAIEMALLDLHLKATGRSLADHIGAHRSEVPAGVSIGLDEVSATVDKVLRFATTGFERVKLKIKPGHDASLVEAIRAQVSEIQIQVDANGSYTEDHVHHLADLANRFKVNAIEQPFATADTDSASQLVSQLTGSGIHIVADEAVNTLDDIHRLNQLSALTAVSIKPARLGGIKNAVAVHDLCLKLDLAATAGGMLESGLGRHALAAVAALPHCSLVGDVSPAARWITHDPWPDITHTGSQIAVPASPGIAPPPDPAVLEQHTVQHEIVT